MFSSHTTTHTGFHLLGRLPAKLRATTAAAALVLTGLTSAVAAPVTYTLHAEGTAAYTNNGGAGYFQGPISIVATGDTDSIGADALNAGGWTSGPLSITFGFGSSSLFSGSPGQYALKTNGSQMELASTDTNGSAATLSLQAAGGTGYALESFASAGPLAYDMVMEAGEFEAEIGFMHFYSLSNITFQAVVAGPAAVPEPASLSLVAGAGLALLLASNRRRKVPAPALA